MFVQGEPLNSRPQNLASRNSKHYSTVRYKKCNCSDCATDGQTDRQRVRLSATAWSNDMCKNLSDNITETQSIPVSHWNAWLIRSHTSLIRFNIWSDLEVSHAVGDGVGAIFRQDIINDLGPAPFNHRFRVIPATIIATPAAAFWRRTERTWKVTARTARHQAIADIGAIQQPNTHVVVGAIISVSVQQYTQTYTTTTGPTMS